MAKKRVAKKQLTARASIAHDGTLTQAEALKALRIAAQAATDALPKMLEKCTTDEEKAQVIGERDKVLMAFLTALDKSLMHNGAIFEKLASDLEDEAEAVKARQSNLEDTAAAIGLLSDLVGLAASLALAFG